MANYPVRRGQLITTFGPGAMMVTRDRISVICAGLDHWFEREPEARDSHIDCSEYVVEEWRLERELGVGHFRVPPDHRAGWRFGPEVPNRDLTIPFLRFPRWHHCSRCYRLAPEALEDRGVLRCKACEKQEWREELVQVRFVAICDHGHVQDFPWREWVHQDPAPACPGTLRLRSFGGTTLSSQSVQCDRCKKKRTLSGITTANNSDDTTNLTENLKSGVAFRCRGERPWLGESEAAGCERPLRGALRSASNVWYAQVRGAIYLPRNQDENIDQLQSILRGLPFSTMILLARDLDATITPSTLRHKTRVAFPDPEKGHPLLRDFTDAQVESALKTLDQPPPQTTTMFADPADDPETRFRRAEHQALRAERDESELRVRSADLTKYESFVGRHFSKLTLVKRLRETRALVGFTRVFPENELSLTDKKAMLWSNVPTQEEWLPANVVRGEGFYLELSEQRYSEWMRDHGDRIRERIQKVAERAYRARLERKLPPRPIGPRHILVHTLAHLLINQLVFECGYSAASLGERLYVSESQTAPMAGVLIYTAAGDSEGTLGGLVRMAREGDFELILQRALRGARWCSADPVCMEAGRSGQGPHSTNLAACHACSLLPETACEEFNQFLDRALLIGALDDKDLAYFVG